MNKNEYLTSVKNGTHIQFYFDVSTEKVMCRCGYYAVWFKTAYLCSSITIKSNCPY